MQQRGDEVYSSAPMLRLLDEQLRVLTPGLQRCAGTHGLVLDASCCRVPPALPLLGCWTSLALRNPHYEGDVQASASEPLPFVDDAFELVLVRHALEVAPHAADLLGELVRVLAPGGTLVVTGVHPLGGWSAWVHLRTQGKSPSLQLPWRLRLQLERNGMLIEQIQRIGSIWPHAADTRSNPASPLGGGYVLVARKRRQSLPLVRLRPLPGRVPANGQLSPSVRRNSIS
ncbi:methyltransferase domain-containing protein [Rhodanobacter sp. AS-Z3]|uniref:class I SAM-dependent methyltransferase n=1 Tax=Rhodanobacter sp. AS-Z3 TaxID=3031330 RepID=UPI00247B1D3F|nr:methyltransferase domain-containing protein [Rhodanobacter sp. AS-Z3]WEN14005.1 methyltransferase domain-containing protein [Rhodanobacter sp. AS-Z3]